jgi:hypothetical protein
MILLAGGGMVLAGYLGEAFDWFDAIPVTILGSPLIGVANWLGSRTRRTSQLSR